MWDRFLRRPVRGAAVRAGAKPDARERTVAGDRRAEYPELGIRGRRFAAVPGAASVGRLEHPAAVPGTGDRQYAGGVVDLQHRSEEHTPELQSLMRISYAVF